MMFLTIIVLMALIVITPTLMGRPTGLSSFPVLIVAATWDQGDLVVGVTGVQPYMYGNVTLNVTRAAANDTRTLAWRQNNNSFGEFVYIAVNDTPLRIHVWLEDQLRNYFEGNVTVATSLNTQGKLVMSVGYPDDPNAGTTMTVAPNDFRWSVPLRGTVP